MKLTPAEELGQAFGYMTLDEVRELRRLASCLPLHSTIVNIGAGSGTSSMAMLESSGQHTVTTIDIEGGVSPLGGIGNLNRMVNRHYPENAPRNLSITGDSKLVEWFGGDIDMIFIDGDHSYVGCKGDVEAWLPRVKTGGIVAFDDYGPGKASPVTWGDVKKVVDEMMVDHRIISVCDSLISFEVLR